MDRLPDELILEVFRFFTPHEILGTLMKVSSKWQKLSFSPSLWRELNISSDSDRILWCNRNLSRAIWYVRKLKVDFATINIEKCLQGLEENISKNVADPQIRKNLRDNVFKEVKDLHMRDINLYNSSGLLGMLKLVKKMQNISSLHLSFRMCHLLDLPDVLIHLTALRSLSIKHAPSDPFYHSESTKPTICVGCSEERWLKVFESINFQTLTEISLRTDNLENDTFLVVLNRGRNLSTLDLDSQTITDDCFEHAPENKKMKSIKLCRVQFGDRSAHRLISYAPCIQNLTIRGDLSKLTHRGIEVICEQYKDIEAISLKNSFVENVNISDVILYGMGSKWRCLRSLCLWFFEEITDSGIEALVNGCPCIEVVDLLNAYNLTDAAMLAVAYKCRSLRNIFFRSTEDSRCFFYRSITNFGFQELIIQRRHIQEILLEGFENLHNISFRQTTDTSRPDLTVDAIGTNGEVLKSKKGKHLKRGRLSKVHKSSGNRKIYDTRTVDHSHLKRITFERCSLLDDNSIDELLKFCPDIKLLNIDLCNNISRTFGIHALKLCPNLTLHM